MSEMYNLILGQFSGIGDTEEQKAIQRATIENLQVAGTLTSDEADDLFLKLGLVSIS